MGGHRQCVAQPVAGDSDALAGLQAGRIGLQFEQGRRAIGHSVCQRGPRKAQGFGGEIGGGPPGRQGVETRIRGQPQLCGFPRDGKPRDRGFGHLNRQISRPILAVTQDHRAAHGQQRLRPFQKGGAITGVVQHIQCPIRPFAGLAREWPCDRAICDHHPVIDLIVRHRSGQRQGQVFKRRGAVAKDRGAGAKQRDQRRCCLGSAKDGKDLVFVMIGGEQFGGKSPGFDHPVQVGCRWLGRGDGSGQHRQAVVMQRRLG